MVNLNLLNRFLLSIVPVDDKHMKQAINQSIANYGEFKAEIVCEGINYAIPWLHSDNEEVRGATLSGILLGAMMADLTKDYEGQKIFTGYIEHKARARGENIIDFEQARLTRRRK